MRSDAATMATRRRGAADRVRTASSIVGFGTKFLGSRLVVTPNERNRYRLTRIQSRRNGTAVAPSADSSFPVFDFYNLRLC
jgi:hypothetical protein